MKYPSLFLDYYTPLTVLYKQLEVKLSQSGVATEGKHELISVILKW